MQISRYFILICVLDTAILLTVILTRKNIGKRAAGEGLAALILAFFALSFFGISLLITNERLRFIFHELKFLPLAFIVPCSMMVYCEFTEQALPFRNKLLLCVVPFLSVIAVLTNNFHHVFRKELYVFFHNGVSYVGVVPAWGYWIYSAYSYSLFVAGIIVLAVNYYKKPRIYRGQIGFLILTAAITMVLNFAVILGAVADYGDLSLVNCGLVTVVQYITIINYSDKRVMIKAWNLVVGGLDSIVMIFDHNDNLIDSNKDAARFSGIIKSGPDYIRAPNSGIDGSIIRFPENGEYYGINERRLFDNKDRYTGRVLVIKDISSEENAANELEYIATHDYLTGLKNRLAFRRSLQNLSESELPAALICVNILGMKLINNIFGNEYGDRVIIRVANELSGLTGESNSCMRLGGDEMGIILRNTCREEAEAFIVKAKDCLLVPEDLIEINLETNFVIMTDSSQNAGLLFAGIAGTMRKSDGTSSRFVSQGFMDSLRRALTRLNGDMGLRLKKISELCMRTADVLLLTDEEKRNLSLLSVMSDIGLLSISPTILKSKGDLSNEQWNEWKLHTIKGHNIALSIRDLSGIAGDILAHHERYDGYGYPMRLKGNEIPLLSRIFSAVEFFVDAPSASAPELLRSRASSQFDPKVIEAVLAAAD